jgi:hypothetical protein
MRRRPFRGIVLETTRADGEPMPTPLQSIRDIQQLRDAPPFAATAVEGLLTVEKMLHGAMRFIPYCDAHRNVWSHHFARIILEAASQVDSIWKASAKIESPETANQKLVIEDHFNRYRVFVNRQHVVFFTGGNALTVTPFEYWQSERFSSPGWWKAYNKLKHDRFTHQERATLDHAVNAVAGLLVAIIYCGQCDLAIVASQLVDTWHHNPWTYTSTGLLRDVTFDSYTKVETKVFAHPIGVFADDKCNLSAYWESDSPRFNAWWALNSTNYSKPHPSEKN